MFAAERFLANALQSHPRGRDVAEILAHSFHAVEPGAAVKKYLHDTPLPPSKRVFALGLGKASCAMTQALAEEITLADALVITKHASPLTVQPVTVIEGNHPIPGRDSLNAGTTAIKFLSQLTKDDLLVCLISGGGSALMTAPRIPLEDLQSITSALLACGARIDEINTLRRHLDKLKGGGVASMANGALIYSLLLSDVAGDPFEAIASGPTAPDPTTLADAISILEKFRLKEIIPASILPALTETPKPDNPIFRRVHNSIIASNAIALHAAQARAEILGYQSQVIESNLEGEAHVRGRNVALHLKELLGELKRPFCLLAGGETTVTIRGNGKGGRNQELALAAVDILAGLKDVMMVSIATDGEDGPTDAAGAFVTGETAQRAESLGMFAAAHLLNNDAYPYFAEIDHLIKTGPSGTNVNDLVICLAF